MLEHLVKRRYTAGMQNVYEVVSVSTPYLLQADEKTAVTPQNVAADRHATYAQIRATMGIRMTAIHTILRNDLCQKMPVEPEPATKLNSLTSKLYEVFERSSTFGRSAFCPG
ncbi:hypothetical protein EVAR_10707_1 [Eumeta japonica]|uniref:Uncharacterized protein n=1 Tax=Eumeta variegata TaxID=151549 RepID=A0A4C1U7W4_EUMVA|nr:hypothetical protein EVAR_10707_1 [Eumeta japonica]